MQPNIYPIFPADAMSYLARYCSPQLFIDHQNIQSEHYSFAECILPGIRFPNQKFGVFAGGRDSYTKYAALFDPIINEYH